MTQRLLMNKFNDYKKNHTANSQAILKSQHKFNAQMMRRFENLTMNINRVQDIQEKFINILKEQTLNSIQKENTILNEINI